jgi:thioredoxin reductase (NADPH)
MELMQKVRDQVDRLGVTVEEVCEIERIDFHASPKVVETEEMRYEANAVIVATGRKPSPLDVPTECEQVHHCAICDGAPYKGRKVLLVGGGNSAFDEGLYLMQLGVADMVIVEAMDRLFAAQSAQDALLGHDKVSCRLNTVVKDLVVEGRALKAAILENTATGERSSVEVDGVFVFLGQRPNSELFKDVLTLDKAGYVVADERMQTNIPGVFSAGDINAKDFRQLTTAAADGTIATLMADRHIRSLG